MERFERTNVGVGGQNGNFAIRDVADLGFDFGWGPLAQIPAEDVQPLVQSGSGAEPFGRRLRAIALRMAAARFKSVGSIPCNRLSAVTPRSWAMRVAEIGQEIIRPTEDMTPISAQYGQ